MRKCAGIKTPDHLGGRASLKINAVNCKTPQHNSIKSYCIIQFQNKNKGLDTVKRGKKKIINIDNWYALLLTICYHMTPSEALAKMRCAKDEALIMNNQKRWKWNTELKEEDIKKVSNLKKKNPDKSIRQIMAEQNISGITVTAMCKRISRYEKKQGLSIDDKGDSGYEVKRAV